MRISLSRWIRQLALIGCLTSPLATPAVAHDLPMQYMHQHYTTECFPAAKQPAAAPAGQAPVVVAKQPDFEFPKWLNSQLGLRLVKSIVRYAQPSRQLPPVLVRLGESWCQAASHSDSSNTQHSQYTLSSPAPGNRPTPSLPAHSTPNVQVNPLRHVAVGPTGPAYSAMPATDSMINLLRESYMPYDMSVRDWKFQRFSHRAAPTVPPAITDQPTARNANLALRRPVDAQPPSPRLANASSSASGSNDLANAARPSAQAPSPAQQALADSIRLVEHWQCVLQAEMMDLRAVRRFSHQTTSSCLQLSQALHNASDQWLAQFEFAAPELKGSRAKPLGLAAPVYHPPLFVVQQSGRHHIVLTERQARQWQDLQWIAPLSFDAPGSLQAWSPLRPSPATASTAPPPPSIESTHSLLGDESLAANVPKLALPGSLTASLHDSALQLASSQLRSWGRESA
jgi:hypothetical protein